MNASKIFITLLISVTFLLNINTISAADGGPRTVIQAMTDVIIDQPAATYLETRIVNSQGTTVIEIETVSASIVISLEGLGQGTYTVETVDEDGDYQEFTITVE